MVKKISDEVWFSGVGSLIPHLTYETLSQQVAMADDFSEFTPDQIVGVLQYWDESYFIEDTELVPDAVYDAVKKYITLVDPNNDYLHEVGATVRGGKVDLPHQMGSLNQLDSEQELHDFIAKYKLHRHNFIITDKEDGYSASVFYNNAGTIRIGYSRGNGYQGADITRHLLKLKSLPQKIDFPNLEIRAEIIISKANFKKLADLGVKSRSTGKPYKNPRNMVSGLMNSSELTQQIYDHIDVIVYHVWNDTHHQTKSAQVEWLESLGFATPGWDTFEFGTHLNAEFLIPYLNSQRDGCPYEIDGVVIEVDDMALREEITPSRANALNPQHSFKYKVASADNVAHPLVVKVEWNISKHNYAKPTVWVEPVNLVGVTVSKATGFNAAFIINGGIAPGARITITRSGDVIPFIIAVDEPKFGYNHEAEILEGFGDFTWTVNSKGQKVDIVLVATTEESEIGKAIDFFTKIGVDKLKEGNVRNFFGAGFTSTAKIVTASKEDMEFAVGNSDAAIIYPSLQKVLANMTWPKLMGASSLMGRGMGERKMQKIYDAIGDNILKADVATIERLDSFDTKSAVKFVENLPKFMAFYEEICDHVTITTPKVVTGGAFTGETVVFTGFRNKNLEERFVNAGAKIASSFSKSVTILVAADPDENSTKLSKARAQGTRIVGLGDVDELFK